MEKRYQVFVSSTFQDLQEERQEVMPALLELDCIPAGMELFPAANEDQWTLIKKVIDDCDYYIVISAGRYGSLGPDGIISYTEMEYRYALEKGKPVIGFLYRDVGKLQAERCEKTEDGRKKLDAFRALTQRKLVRFWESPSDLGSQVSRSLVKLIKAEPAVGWVKASFAPTEDITRELLSLRKRIEELEIELENARVAAPPGAEGLAQGDDLYMVGFTFESYNEATYQRFKWNWSVSVSWNTMFASLAPQMMHEASEDALKSALATLVANEADDEIRAHEKLKQSRLDTFEIDGPDFDTVKVQLKALGLIAKSTKPRSVKDTDTYWTLTPYGDEVMTRLMAVRRDQIE